MEKNPEPIASNPISRLEGKDAAGQQHGIIMLRIVREETIICLQLARPPVEKAQEEGTQG